MEDLSVEKFQKRAGIFYLYAGGALGTLTSLGTQGAGVL